MVRVLKKICFITLVLFIAGSCFSAESSLSDGIEAYKSGNYSGCITIMNNIIKSDPTSVIGYYYLGLAYTKTGKEELARENYTRVINLNSDSTLTKLAREGKASFNKKVVAEEVKLEENEDNDDYNPILNDSVINNKTEQKQVENEQSGKKTTAVIKASDYAQNTNSAPKYNPNREPTNDEIVDAIRILQKAGLLQNGAMNMQGGMTPAMPMDSRTQQMNSMLMMMNGGNNNNNMMQMMPYMNNGGKVDPQLMQMMLMQQMMPNFGGTNNNNGY